MSVYFINFKENTQTNVYTQSARGVRRQEILISRSSPGGDGMQFQIKYIAFEEELEMDFGPNDDFYNLKRKIATLFGVESNAIKLMMQKPRKLIDNDILVKDFVRKHSEPIIVVQVCNLRSMFSDLKNDENLQEGLEPEDQKEDPDVKDSDEEKEEEPLTVCDLSEILGCAL